MQLQHGLAQQSPAGVCRPDPACRRFPPSPRGVGIQLLRHRVEHSQPSISTWTSSKPNMESHELLLTWGRGNTQTRVFLHLSLGWERAVTSWNRVRRKRGHSGLSSPEQATKNWLFHHQPGLSQQDRGYVEALFTAPWNARRRGLASFSLLVTFRLL